MKKLSAYQKLKIQNQQLLKHLMILATEPDSDKANIIRKYYQLHATMDKLIWAGDMTAGTVTAGPGLGIISGQAAHS